MSINELKELIKMNNLNPINRFEALAEIMRRHYDYDYSNLGGNNEM